MRHAFLRRERQVRGRERAVDGEGGREGGEDVEGREEERVVERGGGGRDSESPTAFTLSAHELRHCHRSRDSRASSSRSPRSCTYLKKISFQPRADSVLRLESCSTFSS